jgi:hypothetical protein
MSVKYLNHINLGGNRIEQATIEPLGSAPSNNLQIGRVYYDTSSNNAATYALKIYDGSGFVSITGDLTAVQTSTSDQLVITNGSGPIPSFAIQTEAVSENGSKLATTSQIKTYVDNQITAQDLDLTTDAAGTISIDLDSEILTITGDTGITTSHSGNTVTIDLDDTSVTQGSYGSSTSIPTFTVDQQGRLTAAGSQSISTTLTVDADSGTGDVALATDDLRIVGTTNEIETSVGKSGTDVTVTVGLSNDVSINSQLTVGTASGTDAPVIKSISNSVAENILLESRETSAASAPDLVLYRNAGTPADADTLGVLEFRGRNAMGTPNTSDISYAGFYSRIYDASNQDSTMTLSLNKGNGSGAYKSAAIFKLLGSNNSGTGALLINPASDTSIPTHNLDVNGTAHFSGNVTFAGDVTISGSQTTKNSEVVLIEDNIITLNSNETGTPSQDGGIEIERGTSTNVLLYWDENVGRWSQRLSGGTEYALHTKEHDIVLGTDTSGNYVGNITAGSNISISNAAGEGTSREISVTGLDNYGSWNLKVNGGSSDDISSGETVNFVDGGAIDITKSAVDDITIAHADTSAQASVDNSGITYVQDITLDTYGHVTGITSDDATDGVNSLISTNHQNKHKTFDLDNSVSGVSYNSGNYTFTITHGMGASRKYAVEVIEDSHDYETVFVSVKRPSDTTITIAFGAPVTAGAYRAFVTKMD